MVQPSRLHIIGFMHARRVHHKWPGELGDRPHPAVPAGGPGLERTSTQTVSIAVWDALIIEAARARGCRRVLCEDPQSGKDFDGVVVENPFGP